ncbi:MAG TPA: trimeric intracellular cation channel family protein [Sphingomicrobium sp.]|nr:trimeric intracellular cation channel family protein [Sphingomicrobium sp.]
MNPTALVLLDYFGIAVFAISGALVAAERRLDFVTFVFFAVVTGVGGGTLRDLLIGAPVFWIHTNGTLLICIAAALLVWIGRRERFAGRALLWFDAAGMSAYAAYGAAKALGYGVAPVPAFVMGVLTACTGGIVRDVLAGQPSVLMRRELYVTPAALSAGLLVALKLGGIAIWPAAAIAMACGFALRGGAIARGWSLPAYRD